MAEDDYWTDGSIPDSTPPAEAPPPRILPRGGTDLRTLLLDPVADATPDLFALVDAARVTFLADRLEAEELEHATLFSGDVGAETRTVAPYLVRFRPDAALLAQALDTDSADPRAFGASDAVVFLRASAGLADLRAHFRRFTRQRDRDGAWFYVRFYDPTVLPAYLGALTPAKRPIFFGPVARFVVPDAQGITVLDRH